MASNLLVVTLGTSDVQVYGNQMNIDSFKLSGNGTPSLKISDGVHIYLKKNRNINDYYLFESPRIDGKSALEHLKDVIEKLEFPLIRPFIELLKTENIDIGKVLLVHTDQEHADDRFRNNDTLYFSAIIREWISKELAISKEDVIELKITENATDIDRLYKQFASIKNIIPDLKEGFQDVFLLAQGGIDQINHALTLQLIHGFKQNIRHYQVPETGIPILLQFPNFFIRDLEREKITKHIQDYDFDRIDSKICSDRWVIEICAHISNRLSLQHNPSTFNILQEANRSYKKERKKQAPFTGPEIIWKNLKSFEKNNIKIRDLYLALKIKYHQGNFNDFIWRFFTLIENLMKCEIDNYLGRDTKDLYDKSFAPDKENPKFVSFLESISESLPDKMRSENIRLNNPSRFAYKILYRELIYENKIIPKINYDSIDKLDVVSEKLAGFRNFVAHRLGNVSKAEIDREIISAMGSENSLFDELDSFFDVQNEFGEIEIIRQEILEYYRA
jgi:hypothetical protein